MKPQISEDSELGGFTVQCTYNMNGQVEARQFLYLVFEYFLEQGHKMCVRIIKKTCIFLK